MFKIRGKILATFLTVVIIPIIIVSVFFASYSTKFMVKTKIDDFQQTTMGKLEEVVIFLRSIEKDVVSLGKNKLLLNLVDAIASDDAEQINRWKYDLELLFKAYSEGRGIYDQIRYIDEHGQEIVRIDLEEEYSHIVSTEELQDKSQRYYFKETMKLGAEDIYVSELDLNREHGEIEAPHKPMLRYGTPVFDREDRNRGILVFNVLGDYLFSNILMHEHFSSVDSFFLDKEGFYLLHPEVKKRWGGPRDLNTGENLKNDLPQEVASLVLTGKSGDRLVNDQFLNFIPIRFDPLNDERYWILLESLPKAVAYSPVYTFYKIFAVLLLLLITGVVASAFIFSRRLTRPIRKLAEGANLLAKGGLAFRIETKSKDEIGDLAASFNDMAYQLEESKKQLQDYALNLEEKVEDKTKEIKKSKEYTDNLIETAHDAIISIEENGIIRVWNQAAERIFGYTKNEIMGEPLTTIIPDKYKKDHQEGLKRFLRTGEAEIIGKSIELSGKTKEGLEIPIEISVSFQKIEDKQYSFTAIIRDMTEKKKVEAERKRLFKELSLKNKEMEQLIYVTTHDLRSPLVNIQGFSKELQLGFEEVHSVIDGLDLPSVARGKLATPLEEDIPEALEFILTSTSKMDSLLTGLLRLSRISQSELKTKQLDMDNIISKVVRAFEFQIREAGVTVKIDELPSCKGDQEQINQLFSNLIDNALKYLDPDRKGIIRISGEREEEKVVYCVEDNGIGIAEEHQDIIYEVFHRLNPGDDAGDGLGLSIVHRILDRLGGRVWVESKPGKGSKFFVSLLG